MNDGHCIQYALVGTPSICVLGTEAMTDAEVIEKAGGFAGRHPAVERYDRCPACEAWTRTRGKLRAGIGCPAVEAALTEEA